MVIFLSSINSISVNFICLTIKTPLTQPKLGHSIFSLNKNKTLGLDNIDHYIIRHLYHAIPTLNVYNRLLPLNYSLIIWSLACWLFLKKGSSDGDSYTFRQFDCYQHLFKSLKNFSCFEFIRFCILNSL